MRNFKKIIPRILLITVFLMVFEGAVHFVYRGADNNIDYTVRDLKKSKGQVETVLLGTSLVHWGINGQVLGETIDSTTFNLATSAQPLDVSYYLLKDIVKRNPVKRVFLGIHATTMLNDYNDNIAIRQGAYDRILSPVGKLEYVLKTADWGEHEQYLFYATRVKNILTWEKAKANVKYKLSEDYKNNIPPEGQEYIYLGMGDESTEMAYDGSYDKKKLGKQSVWKRKRILELNSEYLQKIGEFCEKKGIELNIVVMPMTWEYTRLMGDMDDMHDYFQDFCDKNNASLFDFNRYEGIYDHLTSDCYQDKKHLNLKGSKVLGRLLGEWYLEA